MSNTLQDVWLAHLDWDMTANRRKFRRDAARLLIFCLLVIAAVLGVLASELKFQLLAAISAISGAAATALTREAAGPTVERDWLTARAISEALKSEAFRYAIRNGPYQAPDREVHLLQAKAAIEADNVSGQVSFAASRKATGAPRDELSEADYLETRVTNQIAWYESKAGLHNRQALAWRTAALTLGLIGAAISSAAAVFQNALWLAAWSGVVGTIAGAVATHMAAFRYSAHARSYELTARRLRGTLAEWHFVPPCARPARWPEFVDRFEAEISRERQEWLTEWRAQLALSVAQRNDNPAPAGKVAPASSI